MGKQLDVVDGGFVCVDFLDGPHKGQRGAQVFAPDGQPPQTIRFNTVVNPGEAGGGDERLVYVLGSAVKMHHYDEGGQARAVIGVAYRMDPECPFAQAVAQALQEAKA